MEWLLIGYKADVPHCLEMDSRVAVGIAAHESSLLGSEPWAEEKGTGPHSQTTKEFADRVIEPCCTMTVH